MRMRTVALWAGFGIITSSVGAMAIPLHPTAHSASAGGTSIALTTNDDDGSRISAGGTLALDGRLGHASIARGSDGETFLFASITGSDAPGVSAPPLNLAIVVDRSGSMSGVRIANAISAAVGMVQRMRDIDSVTVVAFDDLSQVIVPPTVTTASARVRIESAIRNIRLGGSTCISCGLDEAMNQLRETSLGGDHVNRMILLSDGEANSGLRDVASLRGLAGRMRDRGCSISTVGVDVDFDEKVMAAIAAESNGHHYFVANASDLPRVFAEEFDSLVATVARDGELAIDLAPGVELEEVFDRTLRREGNRLIVPFGTFSAKQEKTVLMKLRVPANDDGMRAVADVKLTFRDLVQRSDAQASGVLSLRVTSDGSAQTELDPFVAARVERSRTAQVLTEANDLFARGRRDEARARLQHQADGLKRSEAAAQAFNVAMPAPVPSRAKGFANDFDEQAAAIATADKAFASSPASAAAPPAKAAVKQNQANATQLSF